MMTQACETSIYTIKKDCYPEKQENWKQCVHAVLDWAKRVLGETPSDVIPFLMLDLNDGLSIFDGTPGSLADQLTEDEKTLLQRKDPPPEDYEANLSAQADEILRHMPEIGVTSEAIKVVIRQLGMEPKKEKQTPSDSGGSWIAVEVKPAKPPKPAPSFCISLIA